MLGQYQPDSDFAVLRTMIGKAYNIEGTVKRITEVSEGHDCYVVTYGIDDYVSVSNNTEKVKSFIEKHKEVSLPTVAKKQVGISKATAATPTTSASSIRLQSVNTNILTTMTASLMDSLHQLSSSPTEDTRKNAEAKVKTVNALINVGKLELQAMKAAEHGDI